MGTVAQWFDAVRAALPVAAQPYPSVIDVGRGSSEDLRVFCKLLEPLGNVDVRNVPLDDEGGLVEVRVDPEGLRMLLHATFADRGQVAGTVACTTHGPRTLNLLAAKGGVYCVYEDTGVYQPSALSVLRLIQLAMNDDQGTPVVHLQQSDTYQDFPALAEILHFTTANAITMSVDALQNPVENAEFSGSGLLWRAFTHDPRIDGAGEDAFNVVVYVSTQDFLRAARDDVKPAAGIEWFRALAGPERQFGIDDAHRIELLRCGLGLPLWDRKKTRFAVAQWHKAHAVRNTSGLLGVVVQGRRYGRCGCFGDPSLDELSLPILCAWLQGFWKFETPVVRHRLPAGADLKEQLDTLLRAAQPFVLEVLDTELDVVGSVLTTTDADDSEEEEDDGTDEAATEVSDAQPRLKVRQNELDALLALGPGRKDTGASNTKRLRSFLKSPRTIVLSVGVASLWAVSLITGWDSAAFIAKTFRSQQAALANATATPQPVGGQQVAPANATATPPAGVGTPSAPVCTRDMDPSALGYDKCATFTESETILHDLTTAAFQNVKGMMWSVVIESEISCMRVKNKATKEVEQIIAEANAKRLPAPPQALEVLNTFLKTHRELKAQHEATSNKISQAARAAINAAGVQVGVEGCFAIAKARGFDFESTRALCNQCGDAVAGLLNTSDNISDANKFFDDVFAEVQRSVAHKDKVFWDRLERDHIEYERIEAVRKEVAKEILAAHQKLDDTDALISFLNTCMMRQTIGSLGRDGEFNQLCSRLEDAQTSVWRLMEQATGYSVVAEKEKWASCFKDTPGALCPGRFKVRRTELMLHEAWILAPRNSQEDTAGPRTCPAKKPTGVKIQVHHNPRNGDWNGVTKNVARLFTPKTYDDGRPTGTIMHSATVMPIVQGQEDGIFSLFEKVIAEHAELGSWPKSTDCTEKIFHVHVHGNDGNFTPGFDRMAELAKLLRRGDWDLLVLTADSTAHGEYAMVQNIKNGRIWSATNSPREPESLAFLGWDKGKTPFDHNKLVSMAKEVNEKFLQHLEPARNAHYSSGKVNPFDHRRALQILREAGVTSVTI